MYLKILRFHGDRAICATDIGKDLDVRRTLLPVTASVGDAFKLGLNETKMNGYAVRSPDRDTEQMCLLMINHAEFVKV